MHNDYARHVHRTWVDTHSQNIRTDPEIYLPGEVAEDTEDENSDNDDEEEDRESEEELATVSAGKKRKSATRTGKVYHTKVAKTMTRDVALNVIDDRRPDLTLIDAPVGETVPSHPYGRHSCLYIEVKVDVNQKPNPRVVCPLFLGTPHH